MVNIQTAKQKCIQFNLRSQTLLKIIEKYENGQLKPAEARAQALAIISDLRVMLTSAQNALS